MKRQIKQPTKVIGLLHQHVNRNINSLFNTTQFSSTKLRSRESEAGKSHEQFQTKIPRTKQRGERIFETTNFSPSFSQTPVEEEVKSESWQSHINID